MIDINEYILLSREERKSRLKLEEPCIFRGGKSGNFRGLLAHILDTTIPKGAFIHLCHGCNNDGCSNPNHLYWGTAKDNHLDQVELGTFKSVNSLIEKKYGKFSSREWLKSRDYSKHRLSESQLANIKSVIESYAPYSYGWIKYCANELGFSHSHIRRLANRVGIQTPIRKRSSKLDAMTGVLVNEI